MEKSIIGSLNQSGGMRGEQLFYEFLRDHIKKGYTVKHMPPNNEGYDIEMTTPPLDLDHNSLINHVILTQTLRYNHFVQKSYVVEYYI